MAAKLEHEGSGRVLEVFTDQPGVQFYTDNFMPTDGSFVGKGGAVYQVIKQIVGSNILGLNCWWNNSGSR